MAGINAKIEIKTPKAVTDKIAKIAPTFVNELDKALNEIADEFRDEAEIRSPFGVAGDLRRGNKVNRISPLAYQIYNDVDYAEVVHSGKLRSKDKPVRVTPRLEKWSQLVLGNEALAPAVARNINKRGGYNKDGGSTTKGQPFFREAIESKINYAERRVQRVIPDATLKLKI